ncbi:UDP-glucose 6-dehydrogenase [Acinetobacter tandoii]|uniref:UDP-glucose dehydrogenase family protein n=1 Tax=Acinetobacter tandoii TaxID=202954 RepID=UPI000C209807|nr:UDP-glucose/GDP-mannose dehydrogenase family protein [Acinetobacter tandoii]PJG42963.1 UDP-glucose 6-dehydrogenase [Acinetobacter tandoii]
MNITVFGIGYVGLVQAAVLAEVGHKVSCIDIDEKKIENLRSGIIPIYEPGLTDLVVKNYKNGRLNFTINAAEGVEHGDIIFIAVGTPPDEDGSADLKYVLNVAETIAEHMNKRKIIINKSTVPVGTADKVDQAVNDILQKRNAVDINYDVVSNPEFLKEGSAVKDCMSPNRIIIGSNSAYVEAKMRELYEPFNRNHDKMIFMDVRSAELTKYAANCMLATKISFMNEIANLAELLGADIENVRKGIGSDERIGYHFIYPGCGYGGSCFPKDVQALIRTADKIGFEAALLQSVEKVNLNQKQKIPSLLDKHFNGNLSGKTFALWGLSFKPNTDDMREAPSRVVMEYIWANGGKVRAYDPEAMQETLRIYGQRGDLILVNSKEDALQEADALIICTEWQVFKAPDFDAIRKVLTEATIFDGRNLYNPLKLKELGYTYYAMGRGDSVSGQY